MPGDRISIPVELVETLNRSFADRFRLDVVPAAKFEKWDRRERVKGKIKKSKRRRRKR